MGIYEQSVERAKRLSGYADRGFRPAESHAIYIAVAPYSDFAAFLKIGMSEYPVERVYSIHCGSPLPISGSMYISIGSRPLTRRIEQQIHAELASLRTRGEWFQIDPTGDDWREVHAACARVLWSEARIALSWTELGIEKVLEAAMHRKGWPKPSRRNHRRTVAPAPTGVSGPFSGRVLG